MVEINQSSGNLKNIEEVEVSRAMFEVYEEGVVGSKSTLSRRLLTSSTAVPSSRHDIYRGSLKAALAEIVPHVDASFLRSRKSITIPKWPR